MKQEPTRSMCIDVVTNHAVDGQHISRLCYLQPVQEGKCDSHRFLNYGAFLSGASAAEAAMSSASLPRLSSPQLSPTCRKPESEGEGGEHFAAKAPASLKSPDPVSCGLQ